MTTPKIRFATIGLNHFHIYGQTNLLLRAGAELVSFYATEPELINLYAKEYPQAKLAASEAEILEDKSIHMVISASRPNRRTRPEPAPRIGGRSTSPPGPPAPPAPASERPWASA